jgi:hypothetical protein
MLTFTPIQIFTMKKILLTVISACVLSFNGIAQCQSLITPTVYANQIGAVCYGHIAHFDINYYGGGQNPTFKLYYGFSTQIELQPSEYNLLGGSNPILMITDPNILDFKIEMTSSDPCASTAITSSHIYINKLPIIYINNPNESSKTVCADDGLVLETTPNKSSQYAKYMFPGLAYSNFSWYKNNTLIEGATDSVYTPTTSGQYYMQYFFSTNTNVSTCNTFNYTVTIADCTPFSTSISGPNPITPGQQNAMYSVVNQTGFSYQWSITGGTIISGENTNSVTVDWNTSSSHSISIVETNQSNQKNTITATINAITTATKQTLAQSGINLFPNPTADAFYIEMPESGMDISYEILDLAGLSIASGTFTSTGNDQQINVDLKAGMYQIVLAYNNVVTCVRLSKIQ